MIFRGVVKSRGIAQWDPLEIPGPAGGYQFFSDPNDRRRAVDDGPRGPRSIPTAAVESLGRSTVDLVAQPTDISAVGEWHGIPEFPIVERGADGGAASGSDRRHRCHHAPVSVVGSQPVSALRRHGRSRDSGRRRQNGRSPATGCGAAGLEDVTGGRLRRLEPTSPGGARRGDRADLGKGPSGCRCERFHPGRHRPRGAA